jgi:hypothetical protein
MRQAYTSHNTRQYLTEKYQWTDALCEDIDWYSHGTALKRLPHNQRRFVQRFIINWLPYNKRLHERGSSPTDTCTLCNIETENESHYIACTSNKQTNHKLHKELIFIFNKHKVDPNLRKIIIQGLAFAIADAIELADPRTYDFHEFRDVPKEYKPVADAQAKLGFIQLWYGRFHLEWDRYQRRYLKLIAQDDEREPSGEPKWIRAVTQTIWQHCHTRWTNRCNTQYENTTEQTFQHAQLLQQVETMYQTKDKILIQEQYMFHTPLEEWQMQPTNKILEWITKTKPIIKQCLSHAKQQTKVHSSDIRKFCTTSNTNKTSTQEKRTNKTQVQPKHTQLNLHNQAVCKPMPTSPTHKKHRRRTHTTSKQVKVHTNTSKHNQTKHNNTNNNTASNNTSQRQVTLGKFFQTKDNRSNHRKLNAKEKSYDSGLNRSSESNQFQGRSGD